MQWDTNYLNEIRKQVEITTSIRFPCLFKQTRLAITAGNPIVELPSDCLSIIRLTYKGKKLFSLNAADYRNFGFPTYPQDTGTAEIPTHYLISPYQAGQIQLCPAPLTSYTPSGPINYSTDVVLSYYAVANPDGSPRLPSWIRTTLVELGTQYRAYMKEGKSQLIRVVDYYKSKFEELLNNFRHIANRVPSAINQEFLPNSPERQRIPRPVLPSNFGVKE